MTPLTLTLALGFLATPADVARDFEAANDRALAGDHTQAIALYRSILERGYDDGDVHYNLAHALESAERPFEALAAYERALDRNPNDEDARENLALLRARLVKDGPKPEPSAAGLADAFAPWVKNLPVSTLGWLAALLLFTGFVLKALAQPRLNPAAWSAFVAAAFGLGTVGMHAVVEADERALVVATSPLLEGPDPRYSSRGEVRAGEAVRILGARDGFREVQRADGATGFIDRAALDPI